ncbi:MAG: FecR family protein [Mangrovibacterium sp.]
MKGINQTIEIAKLIAKSMSGELDATDASSLDLWRNSSPRNETLFQEITSTARFAARNKAYESIDVDRAWRKIAAKITRTHWSLRLAKYAAILVLPLLLGIASYTYYIGIPQTEEIAMLPEIMPASKHAVVVLSSGETIDLKESAASQIEESGATINKQQGELSYSEQQQKRSKKEVKNTLLVPQGGEYSLVLSDGSRVQMNSLSRLTYPVAFLGNKREVHLEGEAYFEVAKDSARPFIVYVNGMAVEVLGTSFNIKAYADEQEIATTLVEGKVKLKLGDSPEQFILKPNQQAVFTPENQQVNIQEVDVKQYVGWRLGIYYFTNEKLEDILKTLVRWYDFDYEFADEQLREIRFEGGLNKYENMYPILDIMKSTGKLDFEMEGKMVKISKASKVNGK